MSWILRSIVTLALGGLACSAESSGQTPARSTGAAGADPHVIATPNNGAANAPTLIQGASAGTVANTSAPENCDPGSYVGNYACKLVMQGTPTDAPIEGVVSFDLEVNTVETMMSCPPGAEFCDFDLVIKEGSGKLFGFVLGFVGFETGLRGGLDCSTGKFHADAVGGIYGIPWEDPNDPTKLKVSVELGTFDGTLDGLHEGKIPQTIAGEWNLGEPSLDIYCPGSFSVELMP